MVERVCMPGGWTVSAKKKSPAVAYTDRIVSMSLGDIRGRRPVPRIHTPVDPTCEDTLPSERTRCTACRSACSLCSLTACVSVASAISAFSVLSFCSFLSIASVGSIVSIASVASINSVASVGSNGCFMGLFRDCRAFSTPQAVVTVSFGAKEWDELAQCESTLEWQKLDKPSDHPCERRPACCTYESLAQPDVGTFSFACRVRLKGHSSFQRLFQKPSLKIYGHDDDTRSAACEVAPHAMKNVIRGKRFLFHKQPCTGLGCPRFMEAVFAQRRWGNDVNNTKTYDATMNYFISDEVTLNNQFSGSREFDAYALFRDALEYVAPLAHPVRVNMFRDGHPKMSGDYAMVESISNGDFYDKHYDDDNLVVHEVELDGLHFKRQRPRPDGIVPAAAAERYNRYLQRSDFNVTTLAKYYAGERLVGHWDGYCLRRRQNNAYLMDDTQHNQFSIVPHGMDHTFEGCMFDVMASREPVCSPLSGCMDDPTCRAIYEHERDRAEARAVHRRPTCGDDLARSAVFFVYALALTLLCLGIARVWQRSRKWQPARA